MFIVWVANAIVLWIGTNLMIFIACFQIFLTGSILSHTSSFIFSQLMQENEYNKLYKCPLLYSLNFGKRINSLTIGILNNHSFFLIYMIHPTLVLCFGSHTASISLFKFCPWAGYQRQHSSCVSAPVINNPWH